MLCRLRPLVVGALFLGFASSGAIAAADNTAGKAVYDQTCAACHGADGEGSMPGVPDLTASSSVLRKPESELIHNTVMGVRSPGSQMGMPPKGGNPALTKEEITSAIRYMRATFLHQAR